MLKKDAYVKKMNAQLDEWSAEIDKLQAKAEKAEAGLQIEYAKKLDELKSLRTAAKQKLIEIKESGDDAWNDFKAGLESAWNELENTLNRFRKEIQ